MYKHLYPSIRVRTAPSVSVRVRVRVSVSFSFSFGVILICMLCVPTCHSIFVQWMDGYAF